MLGPDMSYLSKMYFFFFYQSGKFILLTSIRLLVPNDENHETGQIQAKGPSGEGQMPKWRRTKPPSGEG